MNTHHNTHRFQWIDIAKGIGLILVVYGHVIRGLHSSVIIGERVFYFSDTLVYSFYMSPFFLQSLIYLTVINGLKSYFD
jgi:fucose 4-O-acetylase-like acetyltransferase